jgi:hypothetical protein
MRCAVGTKEACGAVEQRKWDLKMRRQGVVAEGNPQIV